MEDVFERHADRPAVGERAREFVRDARTGSVSARLLPRYETTTYRELWDRIRAVASEWRHHPERPLSPGDRVALLGFTSRDYATLDLACVHLGAVTVPLQTSAPVDQLAAIVAEAEPALIAASTERLAEGAELVLRTPSVRRLVVFDHHPVADDQATRFSEVCDRLARAGRDVDVIALPDVLDRARSLPRAPLYTPGEDEDPLAMLIYTSGSTGTPKGAMYTERLARAMWGGAWSKLFAGTDVVTINYMPMSHVAGHSSLKNALVRGGASYFTASSDLSTFLEDIALVRPTELSLVPRVCELLHQRYQSELGRRVDEGATAEAAAAEVLHRLRQDVLGGRVTWASNSSAPLSAELTEFTESLLGIPLHNVYGSTEAAGISVDGELLRPPVTDYKLADVPELGYFRTDTPHPRGELLLKSDAVVPGYYRQPEQTAELFDADGYYRTGDIVAELGPDRIAVVDRRKSVLKLSQGEFVATARLEAVLAAAPLVRQVFVHGNSERSYLLAVVVPTEDALARHGDDPARLERLLGASFQRIARERGLNSYEIPRGLLLETEPFSQANGLLSDHRKLLWPKLVERYGERLEKLYADIAARETGELNEVRRTGAGRPALETVQRAARAVLAGTSADVAPEAHFRDLGGDSLSAVSLSDLLQDTFGVRVPVDVIISPAHDLRQLAAYVEAKRAAAATRPTFASVHGAGVTEVHAKDLTLDRFLDARLTAGARELPRPAGQPRHVLLTGAGGYLGRFLTLEWLRRLAGEGGRLTVVVRGRDAAAARRRLTDAFGTDDPELTHTFEESAADHLEVLAGDIAEPGLGLDAADWERLAADVDLIVHAGALVNHVLPYDHLFEANVVGTAEVIRLALTTRLKPVTYISSVAVSMARPGDPLDEDSDVRTALAVQPVDDGYASGYATSKWAGEVLLREAHDQCGLPVTVFRSNMILAHSRYAGQLNVPDMFSRLLFSVLATGLAPRSFYRADGDGAPRAHYDGLPVDFTAAAVLALGTATSGHRTYSLVNPHDDGVSLDTFVDWLAADGHGIERIERYDDWLVRLEAALRALPEAQRQYSVLPLLHGFREPERAVPGSVVPSERFRAAVRETGVGAARDVPHLSAALVRKYATDLRRLMTG
ncbi:carboxylic acid reductase [Streptomyces sp. NPDC015220]|uniref:carboxylic acid reductase n=1 Tax=Streptomyces sp. NPDC015220 TaxID=3364947 RepID=UPI0036F9EFAA